MIRAKTSAICHLEEIFFNTAQSKTKNKNSPTSPSSAKIKRKTLCTGVRSLTSAIENKLNADNAGTKFAEPTPNSGFFKISSTAACKRTNLSAIETTWASGKFLKNIKAEKAAKKNTRVR